MKVDGENKRMVVLFIIPSLGRAGAERQLVDLVNRLPCDQFDKHLLWYRSDSSLVELLDTNQVVLHREQRKGKFDLGLVRRIAGLINDLEVDVVHCTLQNALLYGGLASILSRSRHHRLVAAIHTTINVDLKYELADRLLYRWLLKRCDDVWFVCHSQRCHWIRKYGFLEAKSHVIYNGVDSTQFKPSSQRSWLSEMIPEGAAVITCVAGFRPEKGHDILVRAFETVLDAHPNTFLILVGDGPTREVIESQVRDAKIVDKVVFLGQISDVKSVLSSSTVTVLASTAVETFSIAMLESMSMGVPVVATDIGGASEAIENGRNGYLVEPGDEAGLAASLEQVVASQDHAKYLGAAARETITDRFDTSAMLAAAVKRFGEYQR